MTIDRYTADDLHKLLMRTKDPGFDADSLSNEDWDQTAKIVCMLTKFDGRHNTEALETMCDTCNINMEGKTRERIVCEICAWKAS